MEESRSVATISAPALPTIKGETKTETKAEIFKNNFDVSNMLSTAGKIELTHEQESILFAPINEVDVEIRPDGMIYAPWMEYATRLQKVFGMQWALIPQGMPRNVDYPDKSVITWGFWLIVKGNLCGYAIGEQTYHPKSKYGNTFMTFGDACEGAKSNALMRLCKGIGITIELWKPSFIRKWKKEHAEEYKDNNMKTKWRLKGNEEPLPEEFPMPTGPAKAPPLSWIQESFLIEDIQESSGMGKNKLQYTRYGITIQGIKYGTFSETFASIAYDCKTKNIPVQFEWEQEGNYKYITSITPCTAEVPELTPEQQNFADKL